MVPVGLVTATLTAPAPGCAGATAVSVVPDVIVTDVAGVPPKLTPVTWLNVVPVIVTLVPPAVGPLFGLTDVIVGAMPVHAAPHRAFDGLMRPAP